MSNRDLKAKLVIETEAKGQDEVDALASGLEDLARDSGDAAPKLSALADSLKEMAEQDRLVDEFTRLKRETNEAAAAMDSASAEVDKLANELDQAGEAIRDAADAQASAARELATAREYQQQLREAIAQTRTELKTSREAFAQAGNSNAILAEKVRDASTQLNVLQAEEREAASNARMLSAAYKESEASSRNAVNAQKQISEGYQQSIKSASQLSGALAQNNQALQHARTELQAAGIDTKALSQQQQELKARLLDARAQAQQYTDVVREMRGEAQALAPALEQTFKQLGMRGVRQITAEIEHLQAVMRSLKGQNLIPEDAARATAELQRRIEALRAEMSGTQVAVKGASESVNDLGNSAAGAGSKIGEAAHKAVVWASAMVGLGEVKRVAAAVLETGSSFEQLERRLASILGGTDKARQAFAMLQELAQQTPFDVMGLTDAYAKLSAFGLEPTRAQLLSMADAAAALGGGTEMLQGVTLALGQAWTKGKLQGEEILQLAERGIPAWDLLAKATGKTVEEIQKLSAAGQLGRDVILQLIDAMGAKSAGASADLMNTYAGAVQRAQDALQEFFNIIAKSGVLDYLTQQLQGLLAKVDQLKASGELDQWAKKMATGFVELANTAQGVVYTLQLLSPVIEALMKLWVVSKVAAFAGALTGVGAAAKVTTAEMTKTTIATKAMGDEMAKTAEKSRLFAGVSKASLALVALGVIELAQAWLKIAKNYGAYQAELKKHDAIAAQTAQKQELIAQRLKAISEATGITVSSMEELNAAQAEGSLIFDEAAGKWKSAAQAQEQLSETSKKTAKELAALDASTLVAVIEDIAKGADGAEKALQKLAESLKFTDVQSVSTFALAIDELRSKGVLNAQQFGDAWKLALDKLSTGEIGALRANLEDAARQGIISAQQWAQANEQILGASFDKLGVNASQALGKISAGAQEAIQAVDLIVDGMASAGASVQDSARAIEMAFLAAIPKADSLEAIGALETKLKAMGDAGKLSAEGIQRTKEALDKQRVTIEAQIPGIQSLEEALRNLGVKPEKELKALAESAKQAFEAVKASGTATPREINESWKAMAEAAIQANEGVADASLKAQAQQYGMVIETDKAGKSIVKSMKEAEDATKSVGDAAKASGKSLEELAQAGWDTTKDLVTQAREHNAAMAKVESSWIDASVAASKFSSAVATVVWDANKSVGQMAEEHKRLVEVLETLEKQQQQMEDQGSGAAKGVDDLRLRLLELNGTEEEIAMARHQREEAEVLRKQKLMQLDLQRAQINDNQEEIAKLQEELKLLDQQLVLLDQIFKEEEKQRKAKAREERNGGNSNGGGSQQSSGGGTGGGGLAVPAAAGPANFSVELNVFGVTDPVKLARMVEPELEKMSRLKR